MYFILSERLNAPLMASRLYALDAITSRQYEKVMVQPTRADRTSQMMESCIRATISTSFMRHFLETLEEYQPDLYVDAVSQVITNVCI